MLLPAACTVKLRQHSPIPQMFPPECFALIARQMA